MTTTVTRTAPTLTTIGKRQVISTGRWNDLIMADYIFKHGTTRTIEISELARVAYGHNNNDTKAKARRYLHKVFVLLVDRGALMVTEYASKHNRALAVRLGDLTSPADQQSITQKLERMKHRGDMSLERFERAVALMRSQAPSWKPEIVREHDVEA